jgi:hypothetical protein
MRLGENLLSPRNDKVKGLTDKIYSRQVSMKYEDIMKQSNENSGNNEVYGNQ